MNLLQICKVTHEFMTVRHQYKDSNETKHHIKSSTSLIINYIFTTFLFLDYGCNSSIA